MPFLKGHNPWNKGISHTKKTKEKISKTKKGSIPWNKDKKGVMPVPWNKKYKKISKKCEGCGKVIHTTTGRVVWGQGRFCSRTCKNIGKNNPMWNRKGVLHPRWKGDSVGYGAIHDWVRSRLGYPEICEQCGSTKNVEWSNISRDYKRDLSDWQQLCKQCHHAFDNVSEKIWEKRRQNGKYN